MTFPALKTVPHKVGVIVASHNRAHYLPIALQSILDQTHKPERVLVIDDGSTDGTRDVCRHFPVEYHYCDLGKGVHCSPAKRFGFDLLTDELPYVCCVDSDDWIDPDYLERLLGVMESDCRVGVAYPRIRQHGRREGAFQVEATRDQLSRSNCAPSTSLMRSDALLQIGGWPIVGAAEHEDWSAWRRMQSLGWRLAPGDTTYHWRRHEDSVTYQYRGGNGERKTDHVHQWSQGLDKEDLVTIAIPFCGRWRTFRQMVDVLTRQTFPHGLTRLFVLDNSGDPSFGRSLKNWLYSCDYKAVTYFPVHARAVPNLSNAATADLPIDDGKRPYAEQVTHRAAGNWNRIAQEVNTDLVWCLEDDVIPPDNCLERLLRGFSPNVDAVSAIYPSRGSGRPTVRDFSSLSPLTTTDHHLIGGIEKAGHVSMGCVLVRRQTLRSVPMRSRGEKPDGSPWYDLSFWADVARQGGVVKVDADVMCQHLVEGG